jgi:uncharacterized protein
MTGRPALIVSLHDVAPPARSAYADALEDLARLGIGAVSLLVVPNWHGTHPVASDPAFAAWLRDLAAAGHEICLHGLRHRDDHADRGGWRRAFWSRFYTAREGEFYQLTEEEAGARLDEGAALFRQAGLSARGFIAPAWLLSRGTFRAAAARGWEYTTTWNRIIRLPGGEAIPAPTVTASARSGWRRGLSRLWIAGWGRANRHQPVLRIALHPMDFTFPALRNALYSLLEREAATRRVMTYAEWLDERQAR